jgi:hypothetical protein
MQSYLMDIGFDIWKSVVIGYTSPNTPPTYNVAKKASEHNEKSMNVILCGLSESKFFNVMHCKSKKKKNWRKFKTSMKVMKR